MVKLRKLILIGIGMFTIFTLFQLKTEAATIEGNVLSVTPVIHDGGEEGASFYKLSNKSAQQYKVQMIVENMTSTGQRYVAEIQDAKTNESGQIVYMSKSTKSGVRQFVKNKRMEGTIGAKQSKVISFKVKLPRSQSDKRTHLGGVVVMEKPKEDNQHSISNQFKLVTSMTIADGSTETNKLEPIRINKIVAGKYDQQPGYWLTVKNTSNKIINHVKYNLRVNQQALNNRGGENGVMTLIPNETAHIFVPSSQTSAQFKDVKLTLQKNHNHRTVDCTPRKIVHKTDRNVFSNFVNAMKSWRTLFK